MYHLNKMVESCMFDCHMIVIPSSHSQASRSCEIATGRIAIIATCDIHQTINSFRGLHV